MKHYQIVGNDLNYNHLKQKILDNRLKSGYYKSPLDLYKDTS